MPSVYDLFGPFEHSLRSYNENGGRKTCPQGIHAAADCTCDTNHECKRPHCSNDVPLDPCCKLTNGTPYGVPITSWPTNRCHEAPPPTPVKPVSAFSCAITDRLHAASTHSSAAKKRSDEGAEGKSEGKKGSSRLIWQLMGEEEVSGSHDYSRRDGASPSPGRRARSLGGRHSNPANIPGTTPTMSRRSMSSSARVKTSNGKSSKGTFPRSSESEFSSTDRSSSPDVSPVSTPSAVTPTPTPIATPSPTPRKILSPKNSGYQVNLPDKNIPIRAGATPRQPIARFSAVFAGSSKPRFQPLPLNKSASDGVERMRKSIRKPVKPILPLHIPLHIPLRRKNPLSLSPAPNFSPTLKFIRNGNRVTRVSSDSRVDELLLQSHMVMETLSPEQDRASRSLKGKLGLDNTMCDALRKYAIETSRKENGRSYKDLHSILQEKIQELDGAMARSEEQVANTQAWLDSERLWLVHRGGFCAGRKLGEVENDGDDSSLQEGKIRLQLEHTNDVIEVDEDDVEKANPPTFDRREDLSHLRYLNESSILHTLRQRYGSNLIHTYAGAAMVVINPTTPLAIYSEKVIQMFKGCKLEDMPPHIYSVGQTTYRDMINTRRDQSIVFLGRSGAGKTTNFRHVLHYLALAAGACNKILTVEKLNAISTLLEAFGNCRTALNTNATRFTQIFSLDFDHSGQIASASVQVYMPEKMRVAKRPQGEPNYHVFYQLLSGADEDLKHTLGLENLTETNMFMTPLQRSDDKQRAGIAWARIRAALDVLKVSEDEQKAIWSVLSSIYHIGTAGSVKAGNSNKFQFANPVHAQKAASLLGTSVEELARSIFTSVPSSSVARNSYRTGSPSPTDRTTERPEGQEALEGIAAGLYAETFNAIVALINRCISTSAHTGNSILVVDSPGFQNPASCGRITGATFTDLCHNYAQERLQMLFHDATFTAQTDRYAQENIECSDVTDELGTPAPLISLLDKPSSNSVVRTSQVDLREADRRGLLWLLDEEAIFPGASDSSFTQRLFNHYGDREFSNLLEKGSKPDQFTLQHFQGTNPVTYNTQGWLKASRENPVTRQAIALLQESNKEILSRLFVFSRGPVSNTISGSVVGIEGCQSLRRASSIRRTFTTGTASIKRKSVCLQIKFTLDGIVETLRRTRLKFVHCILPHHHAGLCDLKGTSPTPNKAAFEDALLNVPLMRSQIRGCQILDALRIHKQGFPEHLQYSEFRRRFSVLAPAEARAQPPVKDEKMASENLMPHLDLDASSYRLGLSQIFFRTGTISRLEEQRDLVLTDTVVRLQAVCRGVLARRRVQNRKVQETAIRCVQKNVRKFMAVREWPWWRLLVRVTPLLNVHRTEEELRSTKEELDTLKHKFEKIEAERQDLKHDNEKLEARLTEVSADLAEEHSTAQLASERIEAEQSERMRLEKEVTQLQVDFKKMTSANDKLEMEKLTLRNEMLQHVELNGDVDDDDTSDISLYKRKYDWAMREMEVLKKQLKQQQEDDYDQLLILKKQLEKKVTDAYEETDEQRQVVAQMKKKSQRLQAEMNDMKILLEEQTSRNNLLEKKQRKFDQDMQVVVEEQRGERLAKEKIQRERDTILSEKYSYEQEVSTLKLELDLKEEKVAALTRELSDLQFTGKAEEEVALLKKAKHDLELRVKDQEEELDDLAGQVQMLESARVRLEMSIEQMRKENRKELSQRDEELEEVRVSAQKKIKGLESQLESEHDERTGLVREKHDLERRLVAAHSRSFSSIDEDSFHRVKKELKKTKALLKDTQTMLEKSQSEGSNKLLMRQLKTQLEDAEFAKNAAIKARQSAESDFSELQIQLEEAQRAKKDTEDKLARTSKEKSEIQTQLEESEEEVAEVMKKYKATVSQLSVDQINISEQAQLIADLEHDKQVLQDKLTELTSKVEVLEGETANIHTQRRLQMKIKEVESKLDLELTTRTRLESQITRLKDQVERMTSECDSVRMKESQAVDHGKKLNRQLREAKEDVGNLQQKLTDASSRKQEVEKQFELAESEIITLKSDLKLAFKRIEDLQQALQGDLSDSDSEISESKHDIISSPTMNELMSVIKEDVEDDYKESFA